MCITGTIIIQYKYLDMRDQVWDCFGNISIFGGLSPELCA